MVFAASRAVLSCHTKRYFQASTEEIKSSYRRLCKLYHPDRHVEQTRKEVGNLVLKIQ